MKSVALFAGIPPDPAAAFRGSVTREPAYRATFAEGEALRRDLSLDGRATLHGCAAAAALAARGVRPDAIAEHSLGLYAALHAARSIDLAQALALSEYAARLIAEAADARPGGLIAVIGFPLAALEALARDAAHEAGPGAVCAVANFNSAHQAVLGGDRAALDAAEKLARARGALDAMRIPVAAALHTPLMEAAGRRLAELAEEIDVRAPETPILAHWSADWVTTAAGARRALAQELAAPVRWHACVERLRAEGFSRFIDCGPADVLARLARWIDRDIETVELDGADARAIERASAPPAAPVQAGREEVTWISR